MKRLLSAASILGLAVVLSLGSNAAPVAGAHACDLTPAATDDPLPVDCPFCGGDPQLHVRRMNDIAVTTSRLAYSVLDAAIF
jgi:hypothetical protein